MANRNTDLTRRQFIDVTKQWIRDNPEKWATIQKTHKHPWTKLQQIIEKEHGRAFWRDKPGRNKITGSMPTKDDPGVPFTIEPKGNGDIGYKSKPTRKATRGQPTGTSSGTRKYLEHAASPPGTDFHDADRRMGEANARGFDGGHKIGLERTVAGQEWSVQQGRSSVEEYRQNYADSGQSLGHDRLNIEDQIPFDNRIQQPRDYRILDNHLLDLESRPKVGIQNLLDVLGSSIQRGAKKAARNAIPVAGTVMDIQDTKQRFDEFRENPNLMNGAQLVTQSISTGANVISDITLASGIGAPVAVVAEKVGGVMNLADAMLQGTEDYLIGRTTGQ